MKKTNVLIFPAGEINSVELHDALVHNVNIEVFGCSSVDRHGEYIFKNYKSGLPNISEESFFDEFNKLIAAWNIDYIMPTHDTVALYLSENQIQINACVIVAPIETARICRDKKATYELFRECQFCPQQYFDFTAFPMFIKPRDGQGARGACIIRTKEEIPVGIDRSDYVLCEYLPGKEMTVDCITDKNGLLIACLPRLRKRLLAGVCVAGVTEKCSDEVKSIAEKINSRLKFFGLWYFQIKQDVNGYYKLLEISTRCAGTMCLSRARGINLPLLSVYAAQGKEISAFENPFTVKMDRTLISRYKIDYHYDKVYIDYDDTVVEGNDVCLPVIKYLYQCRNKGIKIHLISRHEEDHDDSIEESLMKHSISPYLFDSIIKLPFAESKADYIDKEATIFIDNSYAERKKVHDELGIPVFDIEGIEVIADWRA